MDCEVLTLEGVPNVRDLGGYLAASGKVTKHRRFIRAGVLSGLTQSGTSALARLGVHCVVDLRSGREARIQPSAVQDDERFVRHHLPMLDYIYSSVSGGVEPDVFPDSLEQLYIDLIEQGKESFRQLFELFAHPEYESYLFHCTAGKDRTGIAAALLLTLAGVDDDTIAQDYSYSHTLLRIFFDKSNFQGVPTHLGASQPETMQSLLSHLRGCYGGGQSYLEHIGVTKQQITAVLQKLFE